MNRFFHPQIPESGQTVQLSAEESHHLTKVLRLEPGASCLVIDGKGTVAQGKIETTSARGSTVRIVSKETTARSSRVHLAFGIAKGPSLDLTVRKATEIGVGSLQPLVTEHSLKSAGWNEGRWARIVAEVGKQCEASHFPRLLPPRPLSQWLEDRDRGRTFIFCNEYDRRSAASSGPIEGDVDILVGAEGGWSQKEIEEVSQAGALSLGLGSQRLRAETATLVALVLIKARAGEI